MRGRFAVVLVGIVFMLATVGFSPVHGQATQPAAQTHAEWVEGVLKQISAIKPRITRAEFEKTFDHDGGLFTFSDERYCYRECLCIKVNVTFEELPGPTPMAMRPDEKLIRISRPYLETPFTD